MKNYLYDKIFSSAKSKTSIEFLLAPLLTGTCFCMGETNVEIDEYQKEPCLLYCAVIANESTEKKTGLNIVQDAIREIEVYNKIRIKDSKVNNGNLF